MFFSTSILNIVFYKTITLRTYNIEFKILLKILVENIQFVYLYYSKIKFQIKYLYRKILEISESVSISLP